MLYYFPSSALRHVVGGKGEQPPGNKPGWHGLGGLTYAASPIDGNPNDCQEPKILPFCPDNLIIIFRI